MSGAPVVAWKRAQVLLDPARKAARFAGPVHAERPYRSDEIFWCRRGHRRLDPACECGFYAVVTRAEVRPSVVSTALLEVALEGRVVIHRECVRGERQRVRAVLVDQWCSFCVEPAMRVAGVPSLWHDLPADWVRGVPVCRSHARQVGRALSVDDLEALLDVVVMWDDAGESRVRRSLRRMYEAHAGGVP